MQDPVNVWRDGSQDPDETRLGRRPAAMLWVGTNRVI